MYYLKSKNTLDHANPKALLFLIGDTVNQEVGMRVNRIPANWMISSYLFVFFCLSISFAGSATQTNWSGGNGAAGPVTDWGNEFYIDSDIAFYSDSESLMLGSEPVKHLINGDISGAWSVYSADIDGDGDTDVVSAVRFDDKVSWWENDDGSATSWIEHVIDDYYDDAHSVYTIDLDGDDDIDVLGAAANGDEITWWENCDGSGITWTKYSIGTDFDARSVHASDLDGDGDIDALGASYWENEITWWENVDGSGESWIEHPIETDFTGARCVFSKDIDGDGDIDVLGAAWHDDDITWWENLNGTGTSWVEHKIDDEFNCAIAVIAIDIDSDGDMDILGASYKHDGVRWWENTDGTGISWIEHTVSVQIDYVSSVDAADVDNDGDIDILGGADYEINEIIWWENLNGTGTSWSGHVVDNDFGCRGIHASDLNGDGSTDIVAAEAYNSLEDICWWSFTGHFSEGSLESSILNTQETPDWQYIDWNCDESSGTSIAFQVRASDDPDSMGVWSDILTVPCSLSGILPDQTSYFQYRTILTSTDSLSTPVLHDLTVDWLPHTGTQEGASGETVIYALLGAQPNPALGYAILVFSLAVDSKMELTVYDLSGRVVYSISDEYETGVFEVILDDLASGVYLIRMTAGDFTATRQFVVIE